MEEGATVPVRIVGRYAIYGELAAGGMATVHLGRLLGPVGFSRTVAIKRLHEQFAKDPEFVSMFLDEARLCARIRHPNVVPTLDVIAGDRQLLLVMEYVQGESLSRLHRATLAKKELVPLRVAVAILSGVLHGLHAAHEAKDEHGQPLGIVHRDVSPQNVLVGSDGVARVLDFGIAKAKGRLHTTQDGRVKGKLAYMAPEQLRGDPVDRKSDIFAASIMAWELFTGKRLFDAESEAAIITKVLLDTIPPPSVASKDVPDTPDTSSSTSLERAKHWAALDPIVMRGLERDPKKRFETAREMADLLEEAAHSATSAQVGNWVESVASDALRARTARLQEIESGASDTRQAMDEVITKLTSDADVTKTQERSSGSGRIIVSLPTGSAPAEIATKAVDAVSKSHISVVTPRDPWPKRAAIALACVAIAVAALVARTGRDSSQNTGSVRGAPSESARPAPPPPPPAVSSTSETAASASAVPEASSTPAASAAAATARSATPLAPPPSSTAGPRPAHPTPKPAPTVDCRDPYTRDSLGRKIYKLECL